MGDGMVLLGPRSWIVNLNLQWGCFDSWANYQLSASLKAKKARQVEISLLITARGGSNKRRRWEQLMVDCFHLSSRRRRPCKFGHHPHQTQFQGDYWEFYCSHLVTRRSTAGVYIRLVYDTYFPIVDAFMFYLKLQFYSYRCNIWTSWPSEFGTGRLFGRRERRKMEWLGWKGKWVHG